MSKCIQRDTSATKRTKPAFAALVLALAVATPAKAADWRMFGNGPRHDGYSDTETSISPQNVHSLTTKWTYSFTNYQKAHGLPARPNNIGQPVVASGVNIGGLNKTLVYVGDDGGTFHAVDANSPSPNGILIWARQTGSVATTCGASGIKSTAAIDRTANGGKGAIYVASNARVYAWDLATGATIPGWPDGGVELPNSDPKTGGTIFSGVTVFNGAVYVETSSAGCDVPPYHGSINIIDGAAGTLTKQWFTGTGNSTVPSIDGGAIWGPGGVSIDPDSDSPTLFTAIGNPVPLGATNAVGYYLSIFAARPDLSAIDWSWKPTNLGGDGDFGSTPVPINPTACPHQLVPVVRKGGILYVPEISRTTPRSLYNVRAYSLAKAPELSFSAVAFDPESQLLLVTVFDNGSPPTGPFGRGLNALRVGSNCALQFAWRTNSTPDGHDIVGPDTRLTSVTVANGVAYFAVGGGGAVASTMPGVYAVAMQAGPGGITAGQTLWRSTNIKAPVNNAPAVANGRLFVGARDGKLRAYGLPTD